GDRAALHRRRPVGFARVDQALELSRRGRDDGGIGGGTPSARRSRPGGVPPNAESVSYGLDVTSLLVARAGSYRVPEAAVVVGCDLGDGHRLAVAGWSELHFLAGVVELGPGRSSVRRWVAGASERRE